MPQQERIRCPFCARSRSLKNKNYPDGVYRLGQLTTPPSDFPLLEIREIIPGPGRGHKGEGGGFPIVATYSIVELLNNPERAFIAQDILERFKATVKDYIAAGVLDREELF